MFLAESVRRHITVISSFSNGVEKGRNQIASGTIVDNVVGRSEPHVPQVDKIVESVKKEAEKFDHALQQSISTADAGWSLCTKGERFCDALLDPYKSDKDLKDMMRVMCRIAREGHDSAQSVLESFRSARVRLYKVAAFQIIELPMFQSHLYWKRSSQVSRTPRPRLRMLGSLYIIRVTMLGDIGTTLTWAPQSVSLGLQFQALSTCSLAFHVPCSSYPLSFPSSL